jgi:hypothetical protein
MKRYIRGVTVIGALGLGAFLGVAAAQGQKAVVHVDSAKATY